MMPEIDIHIGGRVFQVACQEGEEHFLKSAAALLDNEAQALADALGRVPEARMLLMAGLMLADKTAGLEEELRSAEQSLADQEKNAPEPIVTPTPELEKVEVRVEVEVPKVPDELREALSKMADRAEGVVSQMEDAAAS